MENEYCEFQSCEEKKLDWFEKSGLVRKFAIWFWEETWSVLRQPACNFSLKKWQSISMCLVRSWNTRLVAMWRVTSLSQYKIVGFLCSMLKSRRRDNNHTSSQVTFVIALYSTSTDDHDTIFCFLDFHETRAFSRKMQNLLIDRLKSLQAAQSTLAKALSWVVEEEE